MNLRKCYPEGRRKAVTLSYDDGVTYDEHLIAIMKQYGLKGTFNLNSAVGPNDRVGKRGDAVVRRMDPAVMPPIYKNQEVFIMSEVLDKIKSRRSIRKYRSDMIPQDKLEKIIEAGTYAATGMGKQSPIIIAVTNKELRDKLSAMNAKIMGVDNMDPFYGAPVVLIVLADKSRPTCVYDGSLVMGNLMLEAEEQGIGSCWIHRAKEEFESEEGKEILKSLGIEGDYEGIGHCILGYADGPAPKAAPRKDSYVYHID